LPYWREVRVAGRTKWEMVGVKGECSYDFTGRSWKSIRNQIDCPAEHADWGSSQPIKRSAHWGWRRGLAYRREFIRTYRILESVFVLRRCYRFLLSILLNKIGYDEPVVLKHIPYCDCANSLENLLLEQITSSWRHSVAKLNQWYNM